MISSLDFKNWLSDPVTVAFMNSIRVRLAEGVESLSYSAGLDVNNDNFMRGFIQGQREVLEVTFAEDGIND